MEIEEKLKKLPDLPGVYIMKDRAGEVLYIGKAKNLKSRVRSYFQATGDGRYAVRFLASKTEDIDYIVTANEKEALFLEDTLLKQHKPRYNIRLKDSKTYVSIKITLKDRFPKILVTRQIKKDGSRYFGPYVSARAVRETIKFIRRIFPLCTCSASVFNNRVRPCLDYQLGICSAPAVGLISVEAYRELVDSAIMFLEGRNTVLLRSLREKMKEASASLDFEKAAGFRDRINAIEEMLEEQKVVTHRRVDQDVFALVREEGAIAVQTLFIREGRLVNSSDFHFPDAGLPDEEVLSSFIAQFYRGARFVPNDVILPLKTDDAAVLEEWLTEKKGRKVTICAPSRGDKLKLLKMAESNAREALKKRTEVKTARAVLLDELKKRLHLSRTPVKTEAFDISNIGGKQAVGAMVAFRDGAPEKGSYRLYRIKGLEGPDDYAMMEQVLSRRYGTAEAGERDEALDMPDLILVDGGKGQLNIAVEVLKKLGITGVDVRALAKDKPIEEGGVRLRLSRGERVFQPNVKDPVLLKEGSRPDLLVRRIRDEVHRFAVGYHRKLRSKGMAFSVLDNVPGIGAKKRKALLDRFGDLDGVANAGVEELKEVDGITGALAASIKEALKVRPRAEES
ncbi:MAG: excinuclease ABC subunit UvrC [Deltaproteobacteria bacterium]|nr:excinuclease ABC subunit UvrC [Deltaproteobacteria bacterium]